METHSRNCLRKTSIKYNNFQTLRRATSSIGILQKALAELVAEAAVRRVCKLVEEMISANQQHHFEMKTFQKIDQLLRFAIQNTNCQIDTQHEVLKYEQEPPKTKLDTRQLDQIKCNVNKNRLHWSADKQKSDPVSVQNMPAIVLLCNTVSIEDKVYRLSTISQYQGHHRRISSTFKEGSLNRKAIKSIGDLNKQTLVPLENIDSQKGIDEFRLQREKLEKMSRMKSRVRLNHMARHEGLATQQNEQVSYDFEGGLAPLIAGSDIKKRRNVVKTFYRVQDDKKPPEKRVIVRIPFLPASSTLSGKHDISRLDSEDLKERLDRELKEIKGVKLSSLQENVADRLSR